VWPSNQYTVSIVALPPPPPPQKNRLAPPCTASYNTELLYINDLSAQAVIRAVNCRDNAIKVRGVLICSKVADPYTSIIGRSMGSEFRQPLRSMHCLGPQV